MHNDFALLFLIELLTPAPIKSGLLIKNLDTLDTSPEWPICTETWQGQTDTTHCQGCFGRPHQDIGRTWVTLSLVVTVVLLTVIHGCLDRAQTGDRLQHSLGRHVTVVLACPHLGERARRAARVTFASAALATNDGV